MSHHDSDHGSGELHVHVTPVPLLFAVWGTLIFFTVITVAATWVDLGSFNLLLAMAIATVKATFVVLYFMHLRWDKPFNAVVFVASLFFVSLFISYAMMDTAHYKPEIDAAVAQAEAAAAMNQP